jgi:hypothetical protein
MPADQGLRYGGPETRLDPTTAHSLCLVTLCHVGGLVVGAAACPAHGAAGAGAAAAAGLGTCHPAALSVAGVGDAAQVGKQVEGVAVQAVEASTCQEQQRLGTSSSKQGDQGLWGCENEGCCNYT